MPNGEEFILGLYESHQVTQTQRFAISNVAITGKLFYWAVIGRAGWMSGIVAI